MCNILSIAEFECGYYCNCDKSGYNCETCYGFRYEFTSQSSKCGQQVLSSKKDTQCPQDLGYTVGLQYECWVLECEDNEFSLTDPVKFKSTSGGVILLLIGICFMGCVIGMIVRFAYNCIMRYKTLSANE